MPPSEDVDEVALADTLGDSDILFNDQDMEVILGTTPQRRAGGGNASTTTQLEDQKSASVVGGGAEAEAEAEAEAKAVPLDSQTQQPEPVKALTKAEVEEFGNKTQIAEIQDRVPKREDALRKARARATSVNADYERKMAEAYRKCQLALEDHEAKKDEVVQKAIAAVRGALEKATDDTNKKVAAVKSLQEKITGLQVNSPRPSRNVTSAS